MTTLLETTIKGKEDVGFLPTVRTPSPTDFFGFFDRAKEIGRLAPISGITKNVVHSCQAKDQVDTSSFFSSIDRPKGEAKRICVALRNALVTHAIQTAHKEKGNIEGVTILNELAKDETRFFNATTFPKQ